MPGKHIYAVNAVIELPPHGRYAGGQGAVKGSIESEQPFTEGDLRQAIARSEAAKFGCDPDGIKFLQFAYTILAV